MGWYDPSLPAIHLSLPSPELGTGSWSLPGLPGASLGAGLCPPLSGAPPARPGALPFVVGLPGASSSWRAGGGGFPPAGLPFSAESRARAREREMRRRRRRPAPRLCPRGSEHRLWGRERRRCRLSAAGVGRRLRVWGAERSCELQSLSLRRAGGWGGVRGCARKDTQTDRQQRGRDGGMRVPSRRATIGGAERVRWGCLRRK